MKTKTLFASLAVASLAIAQPLAAATRSADSLPSAQSMAVADRAGSLAGDSEELRGSPVIPIVLIALIVAAIILAAGGGKSKG